MTTRRAVLQTGAAALAIAGAGAAGFALTRTPRAALEPWSAAGESFGDARLDALAFAVLAPNPHNMQPWRVTLEGDDAFLLHADPAKLLPETDPPNRQITIGFGCFVELFRQAAAEKGFAADVAPFPEGEPFPMLDARPVARVTIAKEANVARDPLFEAALARRTNRAPYDPKRRPDANSVSSMLAAAGAGAAIADAALDAEIKSIAKEAWAIEWGLDRTRRESINVMRIGKREIEAERDGLALGGPVLDALAAAGLLTRESMDRKGSTGYEQSLNTYNDAIDASGAFVCLTTASNTRADQLNAGRAWVRLHQAATIAGVAFQPLSQALQEFPEMAGPYARIHALLAPAPGATVQMLSRIGYAAPPAHPAPRRALHSILAAA
jgi:hypothetical protein